MSTITRHSDKCIVTQISSNRSIEAEVMNFSENRNLTVVMNKSVKMLMSWNGRVYEGRMAGLDFESHGPKVSKTSVSSRG